MTGYTQLQGDSAPTRLMETGDIVHLALWSPLLNQTRCGLPFLFSSELAWVFTAERVEEPVSCMTCLVRTDVFEVPLQANEPTINYFNERVWLKQVFGPPYNRTTECCAAESPCDWHEIKELP